LDVFGDFGILRYPQKKKPKERKPKKKGWWGREILAKPKFAQSVASRA
jgi:translation initiation factor IF-3